MSLPPYLLVPFARCLSSSYELQFDHKTPILSLREMVNNGKLQYDYPVYWKNSDELLDTVGKPSRRLKKDKVLKDLFWMTLGSIQPNLEAKDDSCFHEAFL